MYALLALLYARLSLLDIRRSALFDSLVKLGSSTISASTIGSAMGAAMASMGSYTVLTTGAVSPSLYETVEISRASSSPWPDYTSSLMGYASVL